MVVDGGMADGGGAGCLVQQLGESGARGKNFAAARVRAVWGWCWSGFRSCEELSVSGGSTLVVSSFGQNFEFARLEIFGGRGFLRSCSGSSKPSQAMRKVCYEEGLL